MLIDNEKIFHQNERMSNQSQRKLIEHERKLIFLTTKVHPHARGAQGRRGVHFCYYGDGGVQNLLLRGGTGRWPVGLLKFSERGAPWGGGARERTHNGERTFHKGIIRGSAPFPRNSITKAFLCNPPPKKALTH